LLQSYLTARSYREVQTRGGNTDILAFEKDNRTLYEAKIWKGIDYHNQGFRGIKEYIQGENDDGRLAEVFYVIFDPTKGKCAEKEVKKNLFKYHIESRVVNVVVVNINLPLPSKVKNN